MDWHNTLDGPAAYTRLQTFTQTLTNLLKEVAGSWRDYNPQFVIIISFTGSGRALATAQELTSACAFFQQEGVPFCGYVVTKERRGPEGKVSFMARTGCHILIDDDRETGAEVEQAGSKFFHSARRSIDWAYALQMFAAQTAGWHVKKCHRARALEPGKWYPRPA